MHQFRHPEKRKFNSLTPLKKPNWLRGRFKNSEEQERTARTLQDHGITTVCEEAECPNIADCWSKQHATFMIMGDICTRGCAFCNVATGRPGRLDVFEPARVANAVAQLSLNHVVITSVDRDDLSDGGAKHFARTIHAIRMKSPQTTIEVLTPDFRMASPDAVSIVLAERPDVFNHNIETVPSLYKRVRPGARYFGSLYLLKQVKMISPSSITKSGIMIGMGETFDEIIQVMDDMRAAEVDFLTIGQYLQPTPRHYPVKQYVQPEVFERLKDVAYSKNFTMVSSSPLTRSSYHASEDFLHLKNLRRDL